MSLFELILCISLILVSGYLSSSEIALFSLSRFQLRSIKDHLRPSVYQNIKKLQADPAGLLITILILNEILNVSLSAIITHSVAQSAVTPSRLEAWLPKWAINSLLGTLITAPLVLFACEITPKVIGARANQLVASMTSESLFLLYKVFKPVRYSLGWILSLFAGKKARANLTKGGGPAREEIVKESDFLLMLEEGHREGTIRENELSLTRKVFELDDTPVSDTMKPMSEVVTIPAHTTVKNAITLIRNKKFSRIPVITSAKKVVGIVYAKDLLRAKLDPEFKAMDISAIMRKPLLVGPNLRLNTLFRRLKQERNHMAVVQSESGVALGIVTMGDVLDTLFEDLLAEEDDL